MNKNEFIRGVKSGIPIGLGYLSVSFAFGIFAVGCGLTWYQALIISMVNVTSAGQLAGVGIMVIPGQYLEMLVSQLTINVRYSFMSVALAQKTDKAFTGIKRWLLGFMMTDEIFAVASHEASVSTSFFSGLCVIPYIGWASGTALGAILGAILPDRLLSCLGIAIYGMFIAIVVPDAKQSKSVLCVVLIAILLSCIFYYVPALSIVSSGFVICICAIFAAAIGALLFPVKDEV